MPCQVQIRNGQRMLPVTDELRTLICRTADAVLAEEGIADDRELSVLLVSNRKIRELNRQFRQIDRVTDVLSFPAEEDGFLGDIALSLEKARTQAEDYGHSFAREVAFLVAHSVLHCLGYDHEQGDREESVMFCKQERILQAMGLARPV